MAVPYFLYSQKGLFVSVNGKYRYRCFEFLSILIRKEQMNKEILTYIDSQSETCKEICQILSREIASNLPEAEDKIWHSHPVWFLNGNPIVGFGKMKNCIRLLFWSGQSFDEEGLEKEGNFKAAEIRYTSVEQINKADLKRWLNKSRQIQWDYKNIVKRRGVLERLK